MTVAEYNRLLSQGISESELDARIRAEIADRSARADAALSALPPGASVEQQLAAVDSAVRAPASVPRSAPSGSVLQDAWHYALAADEDWRGGDSAFNGHDADGRPASWTVRVGVGFARRAKAEALRLGVRLPALPRTLGQLRDWSRVSREALRTFGKVSRMDPSTGRSYTDEELPGGFLRTFDDGDWQTRDRAGRWINGGVRPRNADMVAHKARAVAQLKEWAEALDGGARLARVAPGTLAPESADVSAYREHAGTAPTDSPGAVAVREEMKAVLESDDAGECTEGAPCAGLVPCLNHVNRVTERVLARPEVAREIVRAELSRG